ncbi:hypothetical protein NQ317_003757 [Molorchus minor]|uniref:THAP-type domain-containing protein n=1 Tax=Molorchus minor TaxID=1323400 RepID=A0ABQ9JQH9_9CUCU|nr:hypothetical protein NQ317_003757 [Molorchus minor]
MEQCQWFTKNRGSFCSVFQCSNYCTKDISLHNFPKDPKLCQRWKHILKIGKPIIRPHTASKKARLKKGVVPSQKLPISQHDLPQTRPQLVENVQEKEKGRRKYEKSVHY